MGGLKLEETQLFSLHLIWQILPTCGGGRGGNGAPAYPFSKLIFVELSKERLYLAPNVHMCKFSDSILLIPIYSVICTTVLLYFMFLSLVDRKLYRLIFMRSTFFF